MVGLRFLVPSIGVRVPVQQQKNERLNFHEVEPFVFLELCYNKPMKNFNKTAGAVFIFAGGLHLVRVLMGWDMVIEGFLVPAWASIIVAIIVFTLAYKAFRIK